MKGRIFWIVIGTVFLLGIAVFFGLRLFFRETPAANVPAAVNYRVTSAVSSKNKNEPTETATKIVSEEEINEPSIKYRTGGFDPPKIILKASGSGGGCLVRVINMSASPLTIELGPYSRGEYKGPQYAAVPPGGNTLIDPRYRIPKIVFYNRDKPAEEFLVELGEGCKLD